VLFCEECGQPLLRPNLETVEKRELQDVSRFFVTTRNLPQQDARLGAESAIILQVRDGAEPIIIRLGGEPLKVGRMDPGGLPVDIDLTAYSAFHKGVSRFHALLQRESNTALQVIDRGSSNGTFVNGERVDANQPVSVMHGDELAFGQLRMTVQFADAAPMPTN
jgi:pSer/pThr/pTyr-binding forkhead associated (FHA) protein